MAAKQLPIDLNVLNVIAHRYRWLLVILTLVSVGISSLIVKSIVDVYSASIIIFVDPENVLGGIAEGVAVSTTLNDQLNTLRPLILSDDFIEPYVIQELDIRLSDVYTPPMRLKFMTILAEGLNVLKDIVKRIFGFPIYHLTPEQEQIQERLQLISILKEQISLTQSQGRLLTIGYEGPNSTACKKIVEIVSNQCRDLLLRGKNQETREALRYIESQYGTATQTLEDLERELANMRVEQFDKGPEAKIALLQQREEALMTIRILTQDSESANSRKQEVELAKAKRQTVLRQDPEIMIKLAEQSRNQDAIDLEAAKKELNTLLIDRGFTEEWPAVKKLQNRIAELEQSLQAQVQKDPESEEKIFLVDPIYNEYYRQITQIESDQASTNKQIQKLQTNIGIYEEKLKAMPEIEKSFAAIARKIELYEDLQVELAKRRETARATMELEKSRVETRIRVLNRSTPNEPIGISPILIMAAICMIGPGIGGGIVFLAYYLNSSVKSQDDVQTEYNLPVIAVIPNTNFKRESKKHQEWKQQAIKRLGRFPTEVALKLPFTTRRIALSLGSQTRETSSESALAHMSSSDAIQPANADFTDITAEETHDYHESIEIELFDHLIKRMPTPPASSTESHLMVTMLTNPESQAAEEYRRLCFNVEWGLKETLSGPCRTILVTSALPNEGKTLTAINLASTLARNHKVLLLDANFRKPSLHQAFGVEAGPGLSDMLERQTTPQLYFASESPNLTILPAGIGGWHPADLLSSKPMTQFLESIKGSSYFEYTILDVPPVSLIPDSSIIASKVDGIVWVIWELHTDKEVVRSALERITNPAILGVVLNRSEQRSLSKKYGKMWKEYQRAPWRKSSENR